ncbi:transcription elongation factor 1 homolog isoform X2 [Drosophila erecta]|uniref:transcription elongation factor 1 homolog isoform X2 n=1 Tax=Drosophila erecta TaxID=7220 RepID=UPI000F055BA7|nr:transcription elongation factor 1 homolog isoform X2 [Drosophila erecta]
MGRRKSKRKPPPKRKNIEPLDQQFNCPFCNHEKSCEVKMYIIRSSGFNIIRPNT